MTVLKELDLQPGIDQAADAFSTACNEGREKSPWP
jgi:hypothetical protein